MNYYKIACKYVTPIFRIFYNYRIIGADNLRRAAQDGKVVVCTTHSSDLGGMIVGMAVSMVLNTDPYIVINRKFRDYALIYFFLRKMNVIWIMGNEMLGNYPALKQIRDLLISADPEAIIIAPQGTYNKPDLSDMRFRQGFAIPCIQARRAGAAVNVVPALDVGTTYKGLPAIGKRIQAIFGEPINIQRDDERAVLTRKIQDAVKDLIKKGQATFSNEMTCGFCAL